MGRAQGTGAPRQLGLFFFSEEDAKSLVSKIQEQNPKLGKQAQILPVGMDQVLPHPPKTTRRCGLHHLPPCPTPFSFMLGCVCVLRCP